MVSDEYVAGFFDGEGCIITQAHSDINRRKVALSMAQVDRRPLDEIYHKFGGHVRFRSNKYGGAWGLVISKRADVEHMLLSMKPYLIVKAEQAEVALEYLGRASILHRGEDDPTFTHLHQQLKWLKTREALT